MQQAHTLRVDELAERATWDGVRDSDVRQRLIDKARTRSSAAQRVDVVHPRRCAHGDHRGGCWA